MRWTWLGVIGLAGCGSECDIASIAGDGAVATIGGDGWSSAGATWSVAGTGVQINAEEADGWFLTIVAQTTVDGTPVADAIDAGVFPIEVTLAQGAGGFATAYPSDGGSFSTNNAAGGTLHFDANDADRLTGCFSFAADDADGGGIRVDDGAFAAIQP